MEEKNDDVGLALKGLEAAHRSLLEKQDRVIWLLLSIFVVLCVQAVLLMTT